MSERASEILKGSLKSAGVFAIAGYLLINFCSEVLATAPGEELFDALSQNQAAFKAVYSDHKASNLLFMGSSVIEIPLSILDGEYKYIVEPKRPMQILYGQTGVNITAKNYSIEGALLSDQYLLLRKLIQLGLAPKMIVFALTPRDFSDSRLPFVGQTSTFKSLPNLMDMDIAPLYLDSFDDYARFIWGRLIPLYRLRFMISDGISKRCQLLAMLVSSQLSQVPAQADLQPSADKLNQENRSLAAVTKERFEFSHREYLLRYSLLWGGSLHLREYKFLQKFLELCQSKGIYVVAVNMPLTEANKELLPPKFYASYVAEIQKCANELGVPLLDLDGSGKFQLSDFYDAAHLNASGATKILSEIAPYVRHRFAPPERADTHRAAGKALEPEHHSNQ